MSIIDLSTVIVFNGSSLPQFSLAQAWKRRWVVIHGLHDITSGTPIITIDIYPHEQMENQQFERTTIYLNNIKSISRTLSKTHPYAFQVITAECTLFLSGKSETDSQAWILAFRRILWPPVSKMSLEDSKILPRHRTIW